MHQYSKFASTPYKFETEESLIKKIDEYLKWVEDQNSSTVIEYCPACGKVRGQKKGTCCGVPYRREMVDVKSEDKIRPTYYGFASFAGVTRKTLWDYNKKEGFGEVLDQFKTLLQANLEQLLINPYTRNVHGAKFVAINNYGWAERVEMTGKEGGPIEVTDTRNKLIDRLTKDKK